jgi:soluble cytochrome b562
MSEINGPKFSVNQVNFKNIQKQTPDTTPAVEEESPKLKDFSDPKAEALGRSMLIKDVDNTDHDLNALLKNPQLAENSDKMFETALKAAQDAGIENPYEEASTFSTGV